PAFRCARQINPSADTGIGVIIIETANPLVERETQVTLVAAFPDDITGQPIVQVAPNNRNIVRDLITLFFQPSPSAVQFSQCARQQAIIVTVVTATLLWRQLIRF